MVTTLLHEASPLQACWHQDPDRRPPFESVIASLRTLLVQTTLRTRRSQGRVHLSRIHTMHDMRASILQCHKQCCKLMQPSSGIIAQYLGSLVLCGPHLSQYMSNQLACQQACLIHVATVRRPSAETLLIGTEIPSGGGSGMLPDSPRQLTAEACVPLASSVTTLSRSPSSHSHKTHLSSTDPKQETAPKQAPPPETECSLLELATKQMASEHVPNSSLAPNQALVAGSLRSPFEIAAKQMAPDRPPTTSSDVQQEAAPKLAPAAVSAHSPLETTAKQMALQHLLSPRSNSLQEAKPSRHL